MSGVFRSVARSTRGIDPSRVSLSPRSFRAVIGATVARNNVRPSPRRTTNARCTRPVSRGRARLIYRGRTPDVPRSDIFDPRRATDAPFAPFSRGNRVSAYVPSSATIARRTIAATRVQRPPDDREQKEDRAPPRAEIFLGLVSSLPRFSIIAHPSVSSNEKTD